MVCWIEFEISSERFTNTRRMINIEVCRKVLSKVESYPRTGFLKYRKDTYNSSDKRVKSGCRRVLTVQKNGAVESILGKSQKNRSFKCPGKGSLSKHKVSPNYKCPCGTIIRNFGEG